MSHIYNHRITVFVLFYLGISKYLLQTPFTRTKNIYFFSLKKESDQVSFQASNWTKQRKSTKSFCISSGLGMAPLPPIRETLEQGLSTRSYTLTSKIKNVRPRKSKRSVKVRSSPGTRSRIVPNFTISEAAFLHAISFFFRNVINITSSHLER